MEILDNRLEEYLEKIENGASLEGVLASLPAEEADLAPLLRLAIATQQAEHPKIDQRTIQAQRLKIQGIQPEKANPRLFRAWKGSPWRLKFMGIGVSALMILLLMTLAMTLPAKAQSATLSHLNGVVEVSTSGQANDWVIASDGQQIRPGEIVRTRMDSSVALTYADGSKTYLEPESAVQVDELNKGLAASIQLELRQLYGSSHHDVVKLQGSQAFYHVLTPAGQAVVHGTSFNVNVSSQDGVFYTVNHGKVAVSQGQSTVYLTAGQATLVRPNTGPQDPAYEFSVQGAIESMDAETWQVAGVPIRVDASLAGDFKVGDIVLVKGRVDNSIYIADIVVYATSEDTVLSITGTAELDWHRPMGGQWYDHSGRCPDANRCWYRPGRSGPRSVFRSARWFLVGFIHRTAGNR